MSRKKNRTLVLKGQFTDEEFAAWVAMHVCDPRVGNFAISHADDVITSKIDELIGEPRWSGWSSMAKIGPFADKGRVNVLKSA